MTPSKEDYLKIIVQLGGFHKMIANKDIANALNIKAASVTEMIAKLLEEDLVIYTPYKGVQVTEKGLHEANKLIRKHRLWEVFLADFLNYEWDKVHSEADRLEHASSDELMERLDVFLGYPTHDPHGGLIPSKNGGILATDTKLLFELNENERFVFKEVSDDSDLLQYLSDKGLILEQHYVLKKIDPYDNQRLLENDALEKLHLSEEASKKIRVKIVS